MFNKIKNRVIYPMGGISCVLLLIVALSTMLAGYTDPLSLEIVIGVIIASFATSLCSFIFETKLSSLLKILIHWLSTMIMVALAFLIVGDKDRIFVVAILTIPITILYFVAIGIIALAKKIFSEKIINNYILPFGFYYLIGVILNEILLYSIEVTSGAPNFINLCKILIFALLMVIARQLFRLKTSIIIKALLHFILTIASVAIVHIGLLGNYTQKTSGVIPCLVVAAIYIGVSIPSLIVAAKIEKKKEKEYKSQLY